jgi:hypothetical protein
VEGGGGEGVRVSEREGGDVSLVREGTPGATRRWRGPGASVWGPGTRRPERGGGCRRSFKWDCLGGGAPINLTSTCQPRHKHTRAHDATSRAAAGGTGRTLLPCRLLLLAPAPPPEPARRAAQPPALIVPPPRLVPGPPLPRRRLLVHPGPRPRACRHREWGPRRPRQLHNPPDRLWSRSHGQDGLDGGLCPRRRRPPGPEHVRPHGRERHVGPRGRDHGPRGRGLPHLQPRLPAEQL